MDRAIELGSLPVVKSSVQNAKHVAKRLSASRVSLYSSQQTDDFRTTIVKSPLNARGGDRGDENDRDVNVPSYSKKKSVEKPADPAVEVSRERELDALINTGQRRAEEAIMDAGHLGGKSWRAIVLWLLFGIGFAAYGFFMALHPYPGMPDASSITYVLTLFAAFIMGITRAFFLHRRMLRYAFWSSVVSAALWSILEIIHLAIRIVQVNLDPYNAKLYICSGSETSACSGPRFVAAEISQMMLQIFMALTSLYALAGSFHLSDGNHEGATRSMLYAFFMVAMALLCSGVGNMSVQNPVGVFIQFFQWPSSLAGGISCGSVLTRRKWRMTRSKTIYPRTTKSGAHLKIVHTILKKH